MIKLKIDFEKFSVDILGNGCANLCFNIATLYKLSKDILNILLTAGPKQCVPTIAIPPLGVSISSPFWMAKEALDIKRKSFYIIKVIKI